jgi:hypothetical protein
MTTETRDWSATKQRIQLRWPGLPEADLEASQGDRSALLALLQGRLGYARPNAEQDLDEILAGEVVVPADVADEHTHTGTSGPVGDAPADLDAESTTPRGASMPSGASPERAHGSGGSSMGDDGDGWDRRPWDRNHEDSHRMPMGMRPLVIAVVGAASALLLLGVVLARRKRHRHTRTEHVAEQARHLIEEISERMPSVEELRDKVRSLEELREKKQAAMHR